MKRFAKIPESAQMYNLIEKHTHPDPADTSFYVYEDGWDDERVAQAVERTLNATHASTVRKEMKRNLRGGPVKAFVVTPMEFDEIWRCLREISEALPSEKLRVLKAHFERINVTHNGFHK